MFTEDVKQQYNDNNKSDARPTGVQLKREAKLLTVIGLTTKHADCRITFISYTIRLLSEPTREISPTYNSFDLIYTKSP